MIVYRDRTFCPFWRECQDGLTCSAALTDEVAKGAEEIGLPICQFHNDHEWQRLKDEDNCGWLRAVNVDKAIRNSPGFDGAAFLHRSMRPLDEVQFDDPSQLNLFGNECEGMCAI